MQVGVVNEPRNSQVGGDCEAESSNLRCRCGLGLSRGGWRLHTVGQGASRCRVDSLRLLAHWLVLLRGDFLRLFLESELGRARPAAHARAYRSGLLLHRYAELAQ
eukprot:9074046-Alexandrium_andersonii.AAC.1